ncbi:MAG: anhydro-N-acetylmuramic acid kinase [Defluviicoccus sp.]|nr:anhydro-N-acetylmuramic acid kinase [Defluviicoccus sp.]MDE0276202.1 anhydro-N-acetylmuramic acid kinase [Defluviicoccus sp.]
MAVPEGPVWVVGLMSGTSLDGIDAALIETDGETVSAFGPSATFPYPADFRARLAASLGRPSGHDAVEAELTRRHADAVRDLLSRLPAGHPSPELAGFHGHTVYHRPADGISVQIGDGGALARSLGIPVVSDFRGADVAAGGQGAPLAPLYHVALLADVELPVAVLNLGGMANLTWVVRGRPPIAFDTGPGNALIDRWVERHTGRPFDEGGALAAKGRVSKELVAGYLADPFFHRPPPKSVDRLDFSLVGAAGLSVEDGAATLVEVTAAAVAQAVAHLPEAPARWYVTGGGRRNRFMMARLSARMGVPCDPVEALGWQGDSLEAQAFAFLAMRSRRGLPLSLPTTTGVAEPATGGRLHLP